jgi:hypothetical protein
VETLARALVVLVLIARAAAAQGSTADILRQGNEAAATGDWGKVAALVDPLLRVELPKPDRAEAYRLAALAAFYQHRNGDADAHFLAYLRIDPDAQLDPALYQPDVVTFFNDVKVRHAGALRAARPKQKRYWLLNLVPPGGQFQNGDRTKGWLIVGALGTFAAVNLSSFLVLRSWCARVFGPAGHSAQCDQPTDRHSAATIVQGVNILSGIGLISTYLYGVYDGVTGYRRRSREQLQPYVMTSPTSAVLGVAARF